MPDRIDTCAREISLNEIGSESRSVTVDLCRGGSVACFSSISPQRTTSLISTSADVFAVENEDERKEDAANAAGNASGQNGRKQEVLAAADDAAGRKSRKQEVLTATSRTNLGDDSILLDMSTCITSSSLLLPCSTL